MRVLSYGAGVQSVALLRLAIRGDVPKPDVAIFADTQMEPGAVLTTVDRERRVPEAAGIHFEHITAGNLGDFEANGSLHAPLHFEHANGDDGLLRRTCTSRFKIEPVQYRAKDLASATRWKPVSMVLGISLDEAATRMRSADALYVRNEYPLVDAGLTRASCEVVLAEEGIEVAKSACVMCPLSTLGRRAGSLADADDRDLAIDYDRRVRDALPNHAPLFVSRDRRPLAEIVNAEPPLSLFDCADNGACGL